MGTIVKLNLVAIGCLVSILCLRGEAQTNLKSVNQTRFVARIDFECLTSRYPKRSLARLVRKAMEGLDAGDIGVWGNKAIAFDLNKDGKAEYFIPLDCGGTGNCNWGIFGLSPQRCLGKFPARNIYIGRGRNWPVLVTYNHSSASEGLISVYKYAGNRYVNARGKFEVSADRKDFPKSMENTPSTCKRSNSPKASRGVNRRRSGTNG